MTSQTKKEREAVRSAIAMFVTRSTDNDCRCQTESLQSAETGLAVMFVAIGSTWRRGWTDTNLGFPGLDSESVLHGRGRLEHHRSADSLDKNALADKLSASLQ